MDSLPAAILTFPVLACFLHYGFMYAYFLDRGIYDYSIDHVVFHDATHLIGLAVGYLYWQPLIGADPTRWRLSHPVRILATMIGMPFEAFLGAIYMTRTRIDPINTLANTRAAGQTFWILAMGVTGACIAVMAIQSYRQIERHTPAEDRRAKRLATDSAVRAAGLGVQPHRNGWTVPRGGSPNSKPDKPAGAHHHPTPSAGRERGSKKENDDAKQRMSKRTRTAPTRRQLQIVLGLLWLLDAVLQCQPDMFQPDFYGMMLMMNHTAPPAWLWNWITAIEPTVLGHTTVANTVAVAIQFAIGLGLLWRPTVRAALALSIPWAVTVWLFGEMGGGLFVGGGNALTGAPGAALIYAVIALLLWPRKPDEGAAAAGNGLLPRPAALFVWVALWVGTAALEAGYLNRSGDYAAQAMDTAALAGPGWLRTAGQTVGGMIGTHGALFAASAGIAQTAVGLAVLVPRTRKPALIAGAALALFYAVVGQAFGGIFSNGLLGILDSGATDPGTGPVVILLAMTLWPRPATTPSHTTPPQPVSQSHQTSSDGLVAPSSGAVRWRRDRYP